MTSPSASMIRTMEGTGAKGRKRATQMHWRAGSVLLWSLLRGLGCVSSVHKNFGFAKSKAMLGAIGPVARARVMDLWSDDPDRPASPPQRVAWLDDFAVLSSLLFLRAEACQRGVEATRQILQHLMDGAEIPADAVVYVVDMMPSRLAFKLL